MRWQTSPTHCFGDGCSFFERGASQETTACTDPSAMAVDHHHRTTPAASSPTHHIPSDMAGSGPAKPPDNASIPQFRSCSRSDGASPGPGRRPIWIDQRTPRGSASTSGSGAAVARTPLVECLSESSDSPRDSRAQREGASQRKVDAIGVARSTAGANAGGQGLPRTARSRPRTG